MVEVDEAVRMGGEIEKVIEDAFKTEIFAFNIFR